LPAVVLRADGLEDLARIRSRWSFREIEIELSAGYTHLPDDHAARCFSTMIAIFPVVEHITIQFWHPVVADLATALPMLARIATLRRIVVVVSMNAYWQTDETRAALRRVAEAMPIVELRDG
jgi:hypothetical protein